MTAELRPLSKRECLERLAVESVGRLAVVHDGYPVVVPVTYRLVERDGRPAMVIRTRPGNLLDEIGAAVGFEIDGIAADRRSGWSVLVRGVLRAVEPDELVDPDPALEEGRIAWRVIVPWIITGRRLVAEPLAWPFDSVAYL